MRSLLLLIISIFFFSLQTVFATVTISTTSSLDVFIPCTINSFLRVGSKGFEVSCLQIKVGGIIDGIFGPLTKRAVMTFQLNNGLVPDGIVGSLSRQKLNVVRTNDVILPLGCTSSLGYNSITGHKCDGSQSPLTSNLVTENASSVSSNNLNNNQNANPNLVNLDQLLKKIVEVNKEDGKSDAEIKLMTDKVTEVVVNSKVDLKKQFLDMLTKEAQLSSNKKVPFLSDLFDKVVKKTLSFLMVNPSVALASAGLPFGSPLIVPVPCIGSYMLYILPLPPTLVALLSYYPRTQAFAGYNLPFSTALLGTYSKGGVCSYATFNIKTEGTILPLVGSSLL